MHLLEVKCCPDVPVFTEKKVRLRTDAVLAIFVREPH